MHPVVRNVVNVWKTTQQQEEEEESKNKNKSKLQTDVYTWDKISWPI